MNRTSLAWRVPARLRSADPSLETSTSTRWPFEWIYFAATMAAWAFTPLLRRLIDFHNGFFNPVSPASLLPFAMVVPLAFVCLRSDRWARATPLLRRLVYLWIATFAYGFFVSGLLGNLGAAAFALVQYVVPMIAGVWVGTQDLPTPVLFRRMCLAILPCALVTALYGIAQWVDPLPWDVMWVQGAGFVSAFNPVPFGMRIFSSLNSPQPAADFWAMTMVLVFPFLQLRNLWTWPLLGVLGSALMLTLVREAWVGLIVGAVVYLLLSPRRLKAVPALGVFAVLLTVLVTALPMFLGSGPDADVISSRITTLGDVSHDDSALARQNEIRDAAEQGFANPLGSGLGNIGAASRLGSGAQTNGGNVLDSGYLSRFIELGWLGVLGYLAVTLGGPLILAFRIFKQPTSEGAGIEAKVAAAAAVAISFVLAWGDAANDSHYGLDGLFFWLAIGISTVAVASPAPSKTESRSARSGKNISRRFA